MFIKSCLGDRRIISLLYVWIIMADKKNSFTNEEPYRSEIQFIMILNKG